MYLKLMRCVKGSSHLNRTTHQDRVMVVLEAQVSSLLCYVFVSSCCVYLCCIFVKTKQLG